MFRTSLQQERETGVLTAAWRGGADEAILDNLGSPDSLQDCHCLVELILNGGVGMWVCRSRPVPAE